MAAAVIPGVSTRSTAAASTVVGTERDEPGPQRRSHAGVPVLVHDDGRIAEIGAGPDVSGLGTEDDRDRGATAVPQRTDAMIDE